MIADGAFYAVPLAAGAESAAPTDARPHEENKVNFFLNFPPRRNKPIRPRFCKCGETRQVLPSLGHDMSPILPISFVATLLCVLVAIDWALYQQILFVGAALSATVWVCSLEAWSCQEAPAKSEDERSLLIRSSDRPLRSFPAVDVQHMAKDVARAVAAQEQDGVSNVVAIGDAAGGNARQHRLLVQASGL